MNIDLILQGLNWSDILKPKRFSLNFFTTPIDGLLYLLYSKYLTLVKLCKNKVKITFSSYTASSLVLSGESYER